jgi:hypothetical protein
MKIERCQGQQGYQAKLALGHAQGELISNAWFEFVVVATVVVYWDLHPRRSPVK